MISNPNLKSAKPSFYQIRGAVQSDAECYVERQADKDLYSALTAGKVCYVLTSRQMGKSSLMVRATVRLRNEGTAVAVLDPSALGNNLTIEQWYNSLLDQLGEGVQLEDELEGFWLDHLDLPPLQRWMRAIQDVVLVKWTGRVVIFIDEIDFVCSLPFSTDEFFAGIRALYNRRTQDTEMERVTFCLLGVATPSDLIRDTRITPFNIAQRVELTDFTEAEAAPLAAGLGREMGIASVLLKRILYWTGGHPYLTQHLCQAVAEDPSVTDRAGVDRLCEELFLSARARERDDNLLFVRDRILRSEADRASLLDLYLQVLDNTRRRRRGIRPFFANLYAKLLNHQPVRDDDTNDLFSILRLAGITRAVDGYLWVRNRIYEQVFDRAWVTANMPDAELRRQRAATRRGRLQAAAIASVILLLMSGLSVYAFAQKHRADANAKKADENANRLAQTLDDLQMALDDANAQREIAIGKTKFAEEQQSKAEKQQQNAEEQKNIADAQKQEAENQKQIADEQRSLAEEQTQVVKQQGEMIERSADVFRTELGRQELLKGDTQRAVVYLSATYEKQSQQQPSPGTAQQHPALQFMLGRAMHALEGQVAPLDDHTGPVYTAAFSKDGRWLVTASDDRTAKIWEATTGTLVRTLAGPQGHRLPVYSAAFSADNQYVVTTSFDNTAKIWKRETGEMLRTLKGHTDSVNTAAFSPDGKFVVTASDDGTAKIWDADTSKADTGKPLYTLSGDSGDESSKDEKDVKPITSLAVSPNSKYVVIASGAGIAKVLEMASGKLIYLLKGHTGEINSVAFSPKDGSRIVTSSKDGTAIVWNTRTGKQLTSLKRPDDWPKDLPEVFHAAFSPDGERVVTANEDTSALVWDVESGDIISGFIGHKHHVHYAEFSPDGKLVVTASDDKTAKVWDVETRAQVASLDGHRDQIKMAIFSPDGSRVVTASNDRTAKIWDWQAVGKPLFIALKGKGDEGHTSGLTSAVFSADGKRALTASEDKTAKLWNAETGQLLYTLKGHRQRVNRAVFSPDGKWVATASDDLTARVWDAETGKLVTPLEGHKKAVLYIAFSPDSKTLLTSSEDKTARLWDVESGKLLHEPLVGHEHHIHFASFSADGSRVATAGEDKVTKIWETATGKLLQTLEGKEGHQSMVNSAVFSRDGKLVVTGSVDATAKIWNVETGQLLRTLGGHTGAVYYAEFSPDGKYVVTANRDNSARIWEVKSGEMLHSLDEHQGAVRYAAFSPNGKFIVTASLDKTAKIWDADTGKPLDKVEHGGAVSEAHFSADGNHIVTASRDKSARVWDVRLEQRSAGEIAGLVKRFVPYHLEGSELLPNTANRGASGNGASPHR